MSRQLPIVHAKAGMVLSKAVVTKENTTIAKAGVALTNSLISRIKFYSISEIEVEEDSIPVDVSQMLDAASDDTAATSSADPVADTAFDADANADTAADPTPAAEQAPASANDASPEKKEKPVLKPSSGTPRVLFSSSFMQYQLDYATSVASVKEIFNHVVYEDERIDEQKFLNAVSGAFDKANTSLHLFDMLHNMRQSNDTIFAHSVNVALIASTLGKWLKFSDTDVYLLALCGLLHDIGKVYISNDILDKPSKLTEQEFAQIKRHPLLGFNRLKNEEIDPRIKKAALMHHERKDGSGYPHNLKGDEIHPFASIIAIADVYDAMTSSRSYRSPICPFQVIANFEEEGLQKYHTKYLLTFLQNIADTYQNNRVILNDGRSGTIVMLNQSKLSRPIVQLDNNQFVDLSTIPSLYIKALI